MGAIIRLRDAGHGNGAEGVEEADLPSIAWKSQSKAIRLHTIELSLCFAVLTIFHYASVMSGRVSPSLGSLWMVLPFGLLPMPSSTARKRMKQAMG
jgi:hypothetical protein